jgi:hypothetical protein
MENAEMWVKAAEVLENVWQPLRAREGFGTNLSNGRFDAYGMSRDGVFQAG